jgi:pimeloyl-ACP methyl ester carboxylesterase
VIETTVKSAATVDGLRIAYEAAGTGDPPVMLLHGIFGNRGYFAGQQRHLAGRHHVISVDLRAHGESGVPPAASVEDFEKDVIGVLEHSGAGPAVLCGHSILGAVALAVAARRPELVRGLVMLDGVVFFPDETRRLALERLLPALQGDHWMEALRGYLGRLVDPAPAEVATRVIADIEKARREIALSFFDSTFGAGFAARQERHAEALRALQCGLMYVRATSPADLGKLQLLKPDTMVGQVVGSGHYLMLSAADQVNAMLDRFLAGIG